ncbi:HNH endonuclease signature motif containing protein [Jiangella mangrovi]|uniref:HNH endonuclease signature motif containing protein n=1 Tax=Jiangella mangrovi TaxID=1524084 RepID=UPI0031B612ED
MGAVKIICMFEFAAPPEAPPDFGPPDAEGWAEPRDAETRVLLDELAASYAEGSSAVLDIDAASVGPELAALLARRDPAAAGDVFDVVEQVAGWVRQVAHAEAGLARALAELAARAEVRPASMGTGYRSVNPVTNAAVVVAGRCQLTAKQAEGLVGPAVQLLRDFPDTWAAWWAGLIDWRRVRAILDELGGQDPSVRSRVEAVVLPRASQLDSVALRKLIRQLLHELAPVSAAQRHQVARDSRYVVVTPASDGMAQLEARLPAEDAAALNTALNAAAADLKRADAAAGGPVRSKDQRRADALAELGWAALTACADGATGHAMFGRAADTTAPGDITTGPAGLAGHAASADSATATATARAATNAPKRRARPVSVHVTIPFGSLVGLTDEPGELEGYGPITAQVARTLAEEGVWTWLKTDPGTGHLLDMGRTRYRPSQALADFITARDRTCRMPGCHRPARGSDIDHIKEFAKGGTTCAANCHTLCETHHLLKHRGGWTVTRGPDGTTRWRSPTGHIFRRPPERIGPVGVRPHVAAPSGPSVTRPS